MPTPQSCFLISEPDPSGVIIQNLTFTQLNTSTSEKYDYLISWQKPQFSESDVSTYAIECRRTGNPDRARLWTTKKVNFLSFDFAIPSTPYTPYFVDILWSFENTAQM